MNELCKKVQELHDANAYHRKRGKHLQDYTIADNSNHLIEEAVEVQAEVLATELSYNQQIKCYPKNITKLEEELGDMMGVFYHLLIRLNILPQEVERVAIAKLNKTFSTTEVCPNCKTHYGCHGGCTCTPQNAPAATTSEPTVESVKWYQRKSILNAEAYVNVTANGKSLIYNEDGKRIDYRYLGPQLLQRKYMELNEIPAIIREMRANRTIENFIAQEMKLNDLTTHLAEQDKRIAEYQRIHKQDLIDFASCSESLGWSDKDYAAHWMARAEEASKRITELEQLVDCSDYYVTLTPKRMTSGRKYTTHVGETFREAIAAAMAGK